MLEEILEILSNFSEIVNTFLSGIINAAFVVIDMLLSVSSLFTWGRFLPEVLFMALSTTLAICVVKLIFGR